MDKIRIIVRSWGVLVALALNVLAVAQQPNSCYSGTLTSYQTSWIANDGGTPRWHVPHSMSSLFVREDGTVATICGWDEGGTNVGIWRDGKLISIPEQSGTGSWGRNSGEAVVMDDQYVYQLMRFNGNSGDNSQLNGNGLWMYPPKGSGIEYQLITRYDVETGKAARFELGYGPLENMLFVCPQEDRYLQGLTIAGNELIVAVPGLPSLEIPDSIVMYDKTTMSSVRTRGFRITEGGVGQLAADKRGFVWMVQKSKNRIVAIDLRSGAFRPQSTIELPVDVDVRSIAVDMRESGKERLLVTNSGKDLNVLVYTDIYTNPRQSGTFGVTGGILVRSPKKDGGEYIEGEVGENRLAGPTGVGVDINGNIYVSNMFAGTVSAVLQCFDEETQELKWQQEGLVFTTVGDFDQTEQDKVYTIEKIHRLDYTKEGKRMDKLIAHTVNPFKYPQDFRLEPNPPTPIKTGTFKRKIEGRDYLFVNNMYSTILGGYRFNEDTDGYVAIPCMEVRADKLTFWQDQNGDGQKDEEEIATYPAAGGTFSIYPDHEGNIWLADRNTQPAYSSFRVWWKKGIDEHGALQYDAPVSYKLPSYVVDVNRVLYDTERDEMLVACYTTAHPTPNAAIWGQVGTTILTYKNMKQRLANISVEPSENWVHDQELLIPVSAKTTQGDAVNPGVEISAKAMTYAGDYIFTFLCANGTINIYERAEGNRFVGSISPGNEVENRSGWTDFCYAINARKNTDGTYEVLAEENAFAKVLHYTIKNFDEGKFNFKGDLEPQIIQVKNGAGELIDPTDIPEGQPVTFTARIKNIGNGVVKGRRWSDPVQFLAKFIVTDTSNGQVVYEALSEGCETPLYGGEYVDLNIEFQESDQFWCYTKGVYRVEVDANYNNKADECTMLDNNILSLTFGGGDNTGEITGPMKPEFDDSGIVGAEWAVCIWPNPTTDQIRVNASMMGENIFVALCSIDGKIIMSGQIANRSNIDVSSLENGYYLLKVSDLDRKRVVVKKVIVN